MPSSHGDGCSGIYSPPASEACSAATLSPGKVCHNCLLGMTSSYHFHSEGCSSNQVCPSSPLNTILRDCSLVSCPCHSLMLIPPANCCCCLRAPSTLLLLLPFPVPNSFALYSNMVYPTHHFYLSITATQPFYPLACTQLVLPHIQNHKVYISLIIKTLVVWDNRLTPQCCQWLSLRATSC